MTKLRYLWAHHRIASIGFTVALIAALFFSVSFVRRAIYWSDSAHHRQIPEPWMTPGYIARSWHLPIPEVEAILRIENSRALVGSGRPTLDRIATATNQSVEALLDRLAAGLPAATAPQDADAPQ
ncbi:hypothetical protein [Thioclava indica]|uniref:Uncharacterized protein n=1 Tax=Thioclava indica TaxID=1353528 RepID=A0A074JUQ2_9RHOB|nr:hypothetical protein [Thioclava indica]KEO61421.1 hypothetical protein DT23_00210 [Thioclava indica]